MNDSIPKPKQVFRVDRFTVRAAALAEFTARARAAHERPRTLPGFSCGESGHGARVSRCAASIPAKHGSASESRPSWLLTRSSNLALL